MTKGFNDREKQGALYQDDVLVTVDEEYADARRRSIEDRNPRTASARESESTGSWADLARD